MATEGDPGALAQSLASHPLDGQHMDDMDTDLLGSAQCQTTECTVLDSNGLNFKQIQSI